MQRVKSRGSVCGPARVAIARWVGYPGQMKLANLARAKDDLSRYVAYVRRGGRVRILVSGIPAADLVPITLAVNGDSGAGETLAGLEREGILRRGAGGIPRELLRPGPKLRGAPSSVTIRAEREAGW